MSDPASVVFLFDVDNTLLDNDRVTADLKRYLTKTLGAEQQEQYWKIFEELRTSLGYADYLGALQRYRIEYPRDPNFLRCSFFLLDYRFANRLFPAALDVIERCNEWGQSVVLSDGDVVFQPWKVQGSGIFDAVEGRVLIYVHKELELEDVQKRFPRRSLRPDRRQSPHPHRGEKSLGRQAHDSLPEAGPLRTRRENGRAISHAGYHAGTRRRAGEL